MSENKQEVTDILKEMKLDESIFTEEVMEKISLIVEGKVNEKLQEEKDKLEEDNKQELAQYKDELVDKVDKYLNYFVEEFSKENEQDIIDSVKVKTAERVLENFNRIVNDFNVSLSEESVDQGDKIQDLETDLNESVNETIKLREELAESNKYALILQKVMELDTMSEKSKFSKLAESYEYEDEDSFKNKLDKLYEMMIESEETDESDGEKLEETEQANDNKKIILEESTSSKKQYVKFLNRSA